MSKSKKRWIVALTVLIALFTGAWVALPFAVEGYINHALRHVDGYRGQVGSVGLHHLFRGVAVIHGIDIEKDNGKSFAPFFSAKRIDFTIQWSELFRGHVVGEVTVRAPKVNFVQAKSKASSQMKVDRAWQDVVAELTPIAINRFDVHNGEVHLLAPDAKPKVDVFVNEIEVRARNLHNTKEKSETYFSTIDVTANTIGNGKVKVRAKANPLTKPLPAFRLATEVRGMNLPALNPFFREFAKFDVHKGKFDFFFEMNSTPTTYEGYAKPMLTNIDVFDWQRDVEKKNFLEAVWNAVVGTAAQVFQNQPKDRIATRVPFSGTWKKTDVGIVETVVTLVSNAFIRALTPGLEGKAQVQGR